MNITNVFVLFLFCTIKAVTEPALKPIADTTMGSESLGSMSLFGSKDFLWGSLNGSSNFGMSLGGRLV